MYSKWLVLAVLVVRGCWAQAPAYTSLSIVNASDYSSGPFAPNSVLSIFGTNLAWDTVPYTSSSTPTELDNVSVDVNNMPAFVLYVSPSQINFLIPSEDTPGTATVRVVREGVSGPAVNISVVNAAPALFPYDGNFAIATHLDGTLLTAVSPAQPGEIVVVYATGLGATSPNTETGEILSTAAEIIWLPLLNVTLNGAVLPSNLILYAGDTPGCPGLYQLNIQLPQAVPANPVIQVTIGAQSNSGSLQLAVQ